MCVGASVVQGLVGSSYPGRIVAWTVVRLWQWIQAHRLERNL